MLIPSELKWHQLTYGFQTKLGLLSLKITRFFRAPAKILHIEQQKPEFGDNQGLFQQPDLSYA